MQEHVPIWLGGRSARSLRRALRLADGWDPFRFTADELEALLQRARDWPEWSGRVDGFELVFAPDLEFDLADAAQRGGMVDTVGRYRDLGATILNLRFRHRSLEHYLDQLAIFAESIAPRFG